MKLLAGAVLTIQPRGEANELGREYCPLLSQKELVRQTEEEGETQRSSLEVSE